LSFNRPLPSLNLTTTLLIAAALWIHASISVRFTLGNSHLATRAHIELPIDQAIEFPRPDDEGRRKLIQWHSRRFDADP
jgi:hypothetical protein